MTKSAITETKDTVMSILNDEKTLDTLHNLKMRWADEKEYEDWADYEKVMNNQLGNVKCKDDVKFIKGTKRPFGFIIEVKGYKIQISLKTRGNSINLTAKLK